MYDIISDKLDSSLFKFKDCNPVLFPLVFNMQVLSGEPTSDYQVYEQVRSYCDNNRSLEGIDLFKRGIYTQQDLRSFYKAQLKLLLKNKSDNLFKEQFNQLCDYLENPFHYFLMKHDHEEETFENELLKEFPELIDEVSRDNVVTETERELLFERANELGLSADQINHLQNKRFIGYKTFRVLVDQICEDGIITDAEHSFILEKAEQYNVPDKIVSKLLKKGLAKAKVLKEKSVDKDFYQYVVSYFVLRFVEQSIGKKIINENLTDKIFSVDSVTKSSIRSIRKDVLSAIENALSTYLNTEIEINDVGVFLRNLGLNILEIEEAVDGYKLRIEESTIENLQKKYTSSTKEFKGFLYKIDYKSINSNELFDHKIKGDEVTIQLNTDHALISQNKEQIEVIEFFLVTLISTKLEYANNKHINHFWNLFKLYQQHFTLTNH